MLYHLIFVAAFAGHLCTAHAGKEAGYAEVIEYFLGVDLRLACGDIERGGGG